MKLIYVLYSHAHQAVKVGYASDLCSRISCIQTSSPEKLSLLFTFEGGKEVEKYLHNLLKAFRLNGEWFTYNSRSLQILLDYQKQQLDVLTKSSQIAGHLTFDETVIEIASSIKKKFTIAELKKQLPSLLMQSKDVEKFLINNGWEMMQYGSCRTKFFYRE